MKTVVMCILVGAWSGIVLASLVVPPVLSWYTDPGGLPRGAQIQALVQIPEVIRYSTSRLICGQMIGAVTAGAIGFIVGVVIVAKSKGRGLGQLESNL